MTLTDMWLLARKIALGIVITVVPLAILSGGLWLAQRHTNAQGQGQQSSRAKVTSHAN